MSDTKKILCNLPLLFGIFLCVFSFFSSCTDSGVDTDPTTDDTCSIGTIRVHPDRIVIDVGEQVTFVATAYDPSGTRIVGGPRFFWSSNSMAVGINPYSGLARAYRYSATSITITAIAYDCSGRRYTANASVGVAPDTPPPS